MSKLLTISEVSKLLSLISDKHQKPQNYILRYWEKNFKQIRPKIINKRRYYTLEQIQIIKMVKFLLKTKGMTIAGVKNILNSNIKKLDDYDSHSLKALYYKDFFKTKSKNLLNKIKKIKKYGKKNSFES